MSHTTFAAPFKSSAFVVLHLVLSAFLVFQPIALRRTEDWMVPNESSVLHLDSADAGFRAPRCEFIPHRKFFKRYYFDLPSADPAKPEDDRAVVLLRDPQNPQLVVYNHAHWRISQKTKDAKLVGKPLWTPVDSSTKIKQHKITIDLYKQTDFVRQSMQEGIFKFDLTQTACSEEAAEKKESPSDSSSAPEKICGLRFAGGTYYPSNLVQAALLKAGSIWKNKEQVSFNSSRIEKMEVEPSKYNKKMKWIFGISLFGALAPIPAIYATRTLAPMLWSLDTALATAIIAKSGHKRKASMNRTTAAEKMFEKIYCLSGVCDGITCMMKCVDAEENPVVMPRSRVANSTKFRCS